MHMTETENKIVSLPALQGMASTGDQDLVYEQPDELTQHELQQAITILRAIKSTQRGYLLASPTVGGGRALHIVHLDKAKAA